MLRHHLRSSAMRLAILGTLALTATTSGDASAQSGTTLSHIALAWIVGDYVAPLVCEIDGQPVRALRRVSLRPIVGDGAPTVRLLFPDPEARGAKRCFSELGPDEPQIAGALVLGSDLRTGSGTAQREFEQQLRREGGIRFPVKSGRLRIGGWGEGATSRSVDFTGGTAHFRNITPGQDAARLALELGAQSGLTAEVVAPDGTKIFLPLVPRLTR
jgi:hypothetical protein